MLLRTEHSAEICKRSVAKNAYLLHSSTTTSLKTEAPLARFNTDIPAFQGNQRDGKEHRRGTGIDIEVSRLLKGHLDGLAKVVLAGRTQAPWRRAHEG